MEMSKLLPSLQKYYNALHHLEQFSVRSSFFDNIGCLDVFLSEFRSVTLVLQESLGTPVLTSSEEYLQTQNGLYDDFDELADYLLSVVKSI